MELDEKRAELISKLAKVSGMTADEAKKILLEQTEATEAQAIAKIIKEREEEAKRTSDQKARELLVDSLKHGALNYIPNIRYPLSK
jgi:ribonuclease Y